MTKTKFLCTSACYSHNDGLVSATGILLDMRSFEDDKGKEIAFFPSARLDCPPSTIAPGDEYDVTLTKYRDFNKRIVVQLVK